MHIVSRYLPDNAIVSDDSLTAGIPHDPLLETATRLPGPDRRVCRWQPAAIACPEPKIASLQGDSSAMYKPQALWIQARENLDVTAIIYANRSYS
jgi:acetolactate synthase-1/2/3 large subunit